MGTFKLHSVKRRMRVLLKIVESERIIFDCEACLSDPAGEESALIVCLTR